MGVTSINECTVNAVKNWRAAIDCERRASILWNEKWSWICDEYKLVSDELIGLIGQRDYEKAKKHVDTRTVLPFPVTTGQDIGWLSIRPEFKLDRFGPYPNCRGWSMPIVPCKGFYISEEETNENDED